MFSQCYGFTSIDFTNFDASKAKNMSYMFHNCNNSKIINLTNTKTSSNLRDMRYMFSGCISLNSLDLNNFITFNVINMYKLFNNCKKITTIIYLISVH